MSKQAQQLLEAAGLAGIDKPVLLKFLGLDNKLSLEYWAGLYTKDYLENLTRQIEVLAKKYSLPQSNNWLMAKGLEYLLLIQQDESESVDSHQNENIERIDVTTSAKISNANSSKTGRE